MKSANPSIAQSRPAVNSDPADPWDLFTEEKEDLRNAARGKVLRDRMISIGARLLYCVLDDCGLYSGFTPELTHAYIEDRIGGAPRGRIRRYIAALVDRGYIQVNGGPSGGWIYRMYWLDQREGK